MKTFSITDVGMVRQVNQDYVYMTDNPLGPLPNLFVVADGMGGHQAGDYASKYTVEVLKRELENTSEQDVERALVSAIKTANREIIKKASEDPHLKGMGDYGSAGNDRQPDDVFCKRGRQQAVSDQSGNRTAYKRSFSGGRDGTPWRDQAGGSKASSG